jgi:hypothetical protein
MSLLAGEPIATGTHEPRTAVRASGPGRRVSYWIAAAFLLVALLYAGRQLWRETTQPRPNAASTATGPTSESQGLVQKAKALLSRANRTLRFFYNEGGAQRLDDVRRQAERGMRLAPDSAEAQLAMALYESILPAGTADARKRLEELWRQHPEDRRIPRALAVLAQQSRDVEATRIWTERADSLPGGDPYALAQIAWGAWVRGRIEEVGPALERSLARGPGC